MLPVTDDAIMSADHLAALDNFERGIVEPAQYGLARRAVAGQIRLDQLANAAVDADIERQERRQTRAVQLR